MTGLPSLPPALTRTRSSYLPAMTQTVSPGLATSAARCTVLNGLSSVPGFVSAAPGAAWSTTHTAAQNLAPARIVMDGEPRQVGHVLASPRRVQRLAGPAWPCRVPIDYMLSCSMYLPGRKSDSRRFTAKAILPISRGGIKPTIDDNRRIGERKIGERKMRERREEGFGNTNER